MRDRACFGCSVDSPLPARAATSASESTSPAESTEASSTAAPAAESTETSTAATPASAAEATHWDEDRHAASTTTTAAAPASGVAQNEQDDHKDDEDREGRNSTTATARWILISRRCGRWRRQSRVEAEVEFPGEPLCGSKRYQLETGAVVLLHERGSCFTADVTRVGIGDESLGAVSRGDKAVAVPVLARFLGDDENNRASVSR